MSRIASNGSAAELLTRDQILEHRAFVAAIREARTSDELPHHYDWTAAVEEAEAAFIAMRRTHGNDSVELIEPLWTIVNKLTMAKQWGLSMPYTEKGVKLCEVHSKPLMKAQFETTRIEAYAEAAAAPAAFKNQRAREREQAVAGGAHGARAVRAPK